MVEVEVFEFQECALPGELFFAAIASAAQSLRSTWDSERNPPECNTQRSPGATPHVGQLTDTDCFAVSSLFFIYQLDGATEPRAKLFHSEHFADRI
jgi:hypothetical protein